MSAVRYRFRAALSTKWKSVVALALLAIATLAHALVTAVRRRRRDLALLRTLLFTRRQVSASMAWQATTFGVVALVVGIPVGVVLVLLLANLVAFVPGRIAAGLRPAAVLRSE